MVQRATREFPNTTFIHVKDDSKLPFDDNHFELICLFAALTTIPRTTDQKALVAELERVLKPDSGMLYISDCLLNHDERNIARYNEYAQTDENDDDTKYGVFELAGEEALLRHHDLNYTRNELLTGWNIKHMSTFTVTTMNGNPSNAFQVIAQQTTWKYKQLYFFSSFRLYNYLLCSLPSVKHLRTASVPTSCNAESLVS